MKSNVAELPLRQRETIGWVDLLRVLAALLVVLSHNCDAFVAAFDADRSQFLTGVLAGSLTRPCVPLFVMMTGVLLLPGNPDEPLGAFYRKRIGRIIKPLIFWSLALPLAFCLYFTTLGADSANPMLNPGEYGAETLIARLYTWVFNFNFDTVPLWYLYMLIGLYLVMPVISAWLARAQKSDIELMLKVWGISLLLPYLQLAGPALGYNGNWGNHGILGVCDWNVYGSFYYVSGFAGYLLLAYYLTRWPLGWSMRKTLAVCLPMFAAGYALTAGGYVWFQQLFPGDYSYLEIVWLFCGINVMMMTVPVFIIMQRLAVKGSRLLQWLASLSFGVYLCHFVFVYIAYDLFNIEGLPTVVRILAGTAFTALCSLAVAAIFRSCGALRRFVA